MRDTNVAVGAVSEASHDPKAEGEVIDVSHMRIRVEIAAKPCIRRPAARVSAR
jgi:hypothetical protein